MLPINLALVAACRSSTGEWPDGDCQGWLRPARDSGPKKVLNSFHSLRWLTVSTSMSSNSKKCTKRKHRDHQKLYVANENRIPYISQAWSIPEFPCKRINTSGFSRISTKKVSFCLHPWEWLTWIPFYKLHFTQTKARSAAAEGPFYQLTWLSCALWRHLFQR